MDHVSFFSEATLIEIGVYKCPCLLRDSWDEDPHAVGFMSLGFLNPNQRLVLITSEKCKTLFKKHRFFFHN